MVGLLPVHKTTIYLDDDLRRDLDAAARDTGQSQADVIRRAVRAYLGARPSSASDLIGRYRSGAFAARDDEAVLEAAWGRRRSDAAA
jgi:metal-responsive CopG/Arc/MetJ family transcriptional regulator